MIESFLKEKKNRMNFYNTSKFYNDFEKMYSSIDNVSIIEKKEFCNVIDSVFESNRKKVFYKSYKMYGVIFQGLILYKFYHENDIIYLAKKDNSEYLNITC